MKEKYKTILNTVIVIATLIIFAYASVTGLNKNREKEPSFMEQIMESIEAEEAAGK